MSIWVALNENAKRAKILWTITKICSNPEFPQEQKKSHFVHGNLTQTSLLGPMKWKVMQRNQWSDIASWRTKQPSNAWMITTSRRRSWKRLENCPMCVLKSYWNACTWHALVDQTFYRKVNKLAGAVTKWTRACDKRLARLISYLHHTSEYWQYCHVGNTAQQCRLGLFQNSDFAWDLEDSKSASGGTLCVFGSHTFVPISWMCKKQTSVPHGFTRWMVVYEWVVSLPLICGIWLLKCYFRRITRNHQPRKILETEADSKKQQETARACLTPRWKRKVTRMLNNCRMWATSPQTQLLLNVKRSCTFLKLTRQRSRWASKDEVQRWDTCPDSTGVALDWILADLLTKESFTLDEWCNLLRLLIMNVSFLSRSHFRSIEKANTMSNKNQERKTGEESAEAKPRSTCLSSRNLLKQKQPSSLGSDASRKSAAGFWVCVRMHQETGAKQKWKPSNEFSREEWRQSASRKLRETASWFWKSTWKDQIRLPHYANLRLSVRWENLREPTTEIASQFFYTRCEDQSIGLGITYVDNNEVIISGFDTKRTWLHTGIPTSRSLRRCSIQR